MDRLEIEALVMDVDDLRECKSCRMVLPLIFGKTFSYVLPMCLCRRERVVSVSYEELEAVAVLTLQSCETVDDRFRNGGTVGNESSGDVA